jgi:Mannosyltransferase (PIG-V)
VSVGQRLREDRAARSDLRVRRSRVEAIEIFLWSRAAIWIAAIFSFLWFEPNRQPNASRWDSPLLHELGYGTDVWARWDSVFFLRIAEHGYDNASAAFGPLYPALVWLVGHVFFGQYVLAGIVVSLAAALGSFLLLHRLAEERLGADGARRAVLYLAVFPMALFLQAVYSESLFLFLTLAAFALAERRRFATAGVVAGLAILTRSIGIALLPSLALLAWRHRDRMRALAGIALALPVAAIYPLVLWQQTGHPWAFRHAEETQWHRHLSDLGPLGGIWDALRHWTPSGAGVQHAIAVNAESLVFLALFIPLTVLAWRRFGAAYGLFCAISLAIPLSYPSSRWPLLSLPRFGLVVFPFFLALAVIGRRPRVHTAILVCSSLFLGIAVAQWALWQWVA